MSMILLKLFLTFFKIGAFTFGGGYAMLPLIEEEILSNRWMDMGSLINFIAVSESTPGPFAVNISTYIGSETAGFPGALCASLGVILPSFIIILLVARCFEKFKENRLVSGLMKGLRPAVIGFIGAAVISVGGNVLFPQGVVVDSFISKRFITSIIILGVMAFGLKKKWHPIIIIVFSAVLGIGSGYLGLI